PNGGKPHWQRAASGTLKLRCDAPLGAIKKGRELISRPLVFYGLHVQSKRLHLFFVFVLILVVFYFILGINHIVIVAGALRCGLVGSAAGLLLIASIFIN